MDDALEGLLMDRMLETCGMGEMVGGWMIGWEEEVMRA